MINGSASGSLGVWLDKGICYVYTQESQDKGFIDCYAGQEGNTDVMYGRRISEWSDFLTT